MWRRAGQSLRRFSTAVRRRIEDEGDWFYASEWWGTGQSDGHTVLRSTSDKGNGVVSVVAFPSSRPSELYWPATERWLRHRYAEAFPGEEEDNARFYVLGYQWRSLRFNDETRQSTVKVMAASRASEPGSVFLMQQPHCLAVPYLKSMMSVGLATLASCNYDLKSAVLGKKKMHVLCIGHGGGSLPLFLASKIQGKHLENVTRADEYQKFLLSGAVVHTVEIDPLVISASVQEMGFPAFSVMTPSGNRAFPKPDKMDEVLWKGTHERLYLYESDAEKFILNTTNVYDLIFIDAYDGDDIFPHALWDPDSLFLKALSNQLQPEHGTVVVNLHSDSDLLNPDGSVPSVLEQVLPMGKHVSKVGRAYKDVLTRNTSSSGGRTSGLGFTVSVPWVCNTSLVVCKGSGVIDANFSRDTILETLVSKSTEVDQILNLPFSCLQYIKRGFVFLD